ncbi:hypothetical protein HDU67_007376 [Dinochytrium kinnereticum]|nr:hypothetical protein HDU67_007376 [Dinochytrium kinnereticum]
MFPPVSQIRIVPRTRMKVCLIFNDTVNAPIQDGDESLLLVTLPHPRNGDSVLFALNATTEVLFEIQRMETDLDTNDHVTPIRSAMFGAHILQDGNVNAFTPFDLLFLLLPALEVARGKTGTGKWDEIDNILFNNQFPDLNYFSTWAKLPKILETICDVNATIPDHTFYRLNDEKVITWLEAKVTKVLSKSSAYDCMKPAAESQIQFSEEDLKGSSTKASVMSADSKGYKYYMDIPLGRGGSGGDGSLESKKENISEKAKAAKQSNGVKKLAKASTKGMKTLNNFFVKK